MRDPGLRCSVRTTFETLYSSIGVNYETKAPEIKSSDDLCSE